MKKEKQSNKNKVEVKDKEKTNKSKKQVNSNEDTIGIMTLIGTMCGIFALLVVLFTMPFVIVRGIQNNSYGHYTDAKYKSDTISLEQLLTKHESSVYYVYIYQEDCSGCKELEQYILKYIKKGPRPLYLLDGDKYETSLIEVDYENQSIITNYEVSDYKDLRVGQFPCLLMVSNGEVIAHNLGKTSIYNQLQIR